MRRIQLDFLADMNYVPILITKNMRSRSELNVIPVFTLDFHQIAVDPEKLEPDPAEDVPVLLGHESQADVGLVGEGCWTDAQGEQTVV